MNKYAYIRVSSKDQNVSRQIEAMENVGILEKDMFIDKQSGKDFNREQYQLLLTKLQSGDELYVKSIDRFGRDYDEIQEQWRYLTKKVCIDIVVLDFPLLDTRNQVNGITGKFVSDLVLQILSYVAQVERENTKQRQAEGIRLAKERGVRLGRPPKPIPEDFEKIYKLWKENKISKRRGAQMLNTNHSTFSSWIRAYERNNEMNNENSVVKCE
ncbi:MAG: recombinase family protein [Erysipelotrichaceae bacterium]|nr:recombinase family protein [Erysipelotrichaceae bacterium]